LLEILPWLLVYYVKNRIQPDLSSARSVALETVHINRVTQGAGASSSSHVVFIYLQKFCLAFSILPLFWLLDVGVSIATSATNVSIYHMHCCLCYSALLLAEISYYCLTEATRAHILFVLTFSAVL
jgi:hypothetical protein